MDTKDLELLNLREAAELLKVSETSLRRWTNGGLLTCVRLGPKRERRFRRADLLAFLRKPAGGQALPSAISEIHTRQTVVAGVSLEHGAHFCSLYASDSGRTTLAVGFLADGLYEGSACYLVATPKAAEAFLAQLRRTHHGVEEALEAGRLVVMEYASDAKEHIQRLEARFRASLRAGAKSIRLVGNMSEGQLMRGKPIENSLRYEEDYDTNLAQRFPLVTLCQYDARRHSGLELLEVYKRHGAMFRYPRERLLF